jgi:hypothetical protein
MIPTPLYLAVVGKLVSLVKVTRPWRSQIAITLIALGAALLVLPAIAHAECPNEQLRQSTMVSNVDPVTGQPYNLGLPDCRAHEQVSPAEKDGSSGGVLNFDYHEQAGPEGTPGTPMQALADGSAITYTGEPFYNVKPGVFIGGVEQYTSVRSASGWGTVNGDTLSLKEAPTEAPVPVLPTIAETSVKFVEDIRVVEETADGAKVFFLDAANTVESEPDLYEYDVSSRQLTDLTVDKNGGEHADVRGILGIGGEGAGVGSYVYFVAGGLLASGASPGGCGVNGNGSASGTGCNLYLRHAGTTTFVATLAPGDEAGEQGSAGVVGITNPRDWPPLPFMRTAVVSPNGRYVAFVDVPRSGPDTGVREIFRYDAGMVTNGEPSSLVCVSCSPTGTIAVPEAILPSSPRALINGANRQRSMLDDGRVFFSTTAALVSQDVNRQVDVYEWEAGAPRLISGGTSELDRSVFTDASANGSDVFFTTSQSLVPQDSDGIVDVYDAREGGGFPPPPPGCPIETACPGPVALPALGGAPTSATFTGTEGAPVAVVSKPPAPKPLTRSQKLIKALKACHARRSKKARAACETAARKRYGTTHRANKPKHRGR